MWKSETIEFKNKTFYDILAQEQCFLESKAIVEIH